MKPMLAPLYTSTLFLLFVTLLMSGESTTIYSPTNVINLDCGTSGDMFNYYDSQTWSGDINSKLSPIEAAGSTSHVYKAPSLSSTASEVPYDTARLSHSDFTYRLPVSPGQLFIRLYFNPATYYADDFDRSRSLFSVKAGGFTLLKDFNASVSADADYAKTMLKEYCINIEAQQHILNITFTPSKDGYAFINGIQIMFMPADLYYTAALGNDGPHIIGSENNIPVKTTTALELFYRMNVGGSGLSPNEDTGMFRTWDANDDLYLDYISEKYSGPTPRYYSQLNFSSIRDYNIAPEEVYRTGRSMRGNKTINKSNNLTWVLPVDPQFYYLVRLHFCEIVYDMDQDRVFQIFIDDQTAEQKFDIIVQSGGNGVPVYKDYLVFVPSLPENKKGEVDISVALQAYQDDSETRYSSAILNGLEIFKPSDTNDNLAGPNPDPPPRKEIQRVKPEIPRRSKNKSIPMLAILAGVVSVLLVLSIVGFLLFRRGKVVNDSSSSKETKWGKANSEPGQFIPTNLFRYFQLQEIAAATKNFNDSFIVGAGGFGNVYKGCIDGGATPVAIKRLKQESSQGVHEFKTEIEMLSQLRHRHLVSLIGYCADKGEMILVYEYMSHGTLRDHLYHTDNPPLPWEQRLQICIGTARGLQYLHSGAKGTIIHRDVKSTNILLDEKWVAKVSDFGLSKGTTNMSTTHISTMVKGSFGYLDPEYYRRQRLTEKSDVYSLGVVLFEVLCARPAVIQAEELKQVSLAEWAKSCHQNGELDQIIDPSLRGKIAAECLNKFTEVAISCMHDNGTERPPMNDVVKELELALLLQQSAEGNINCGKRIGEAETSSGEQSCTTNNSITRISGTIFSEIISPTGR